MIAEIRWNADLRAWAAYDLATEDLVAWDIYRDRLALTVEDLEYFPVES
jgi:hypothetical protein